MYPIGVVGPGAERLAKRLTEHLAEHGRVGVVTNRRPDGNRADSEQGGTTPSADGGTAVAETRTEELDRYRTAGAASVYGLDDEGWSAIGGGMDLHDALYAMAPARDFCVVEGPIGSAEDLPLVVLGGVEASSATDVDADAAGGLVLARAPTADAIDPEEVRETLEATEPIETLESLVEGVKASPEAPQSGAIATFTGRVRAQEDAEDTPTEYLAFEKYEGVADERMAQISSELEAREGIYEVLMHHRSGRLDYGEDIVFVVVLAGHRGEAFETVEDGIDRLKAEVPIFKKEVTVDEEFWVHDRP
jgi:molybdopterin synthase catalytic subunit